MKNKLKSLNKALNGRKIYVGAEFEFIAPSLSLEIYYPYIIRERLYKLRPPFKNWQVTRREHDNRNQKRVGQDSCWYFKDDGSLNFGGVELTSPPIELSEFLKICPSVFKWIDKVGTVDSSCGFHIHLSITNKRGNGLQSLKEINSLKMALLLNEQHIWKHFKNRRFNGYCLTKFSSSALLDILLRPNLDLDVPHRIRDFYCHYSGLNLENARKNHVEFRYIGGRDYHKKFRAVQEVIFTYIDSLLAGVLPQYKKSQYFSTYRKLKEDVRKYFHNLSKMSYDDHIEEAIDSFKYEEESLAYSTREINEVKHRLKKITSKTIKQHSKLNKKRFKEQWSYKDDWGDMNNTLEEFDAAYNYEDPNKQETLEKIHKKALSEFRRNKKLLEIYNEIGL
jgi:hypothetical protein